MQIRPRIATTPTCGGVCNRRNFNRAAGEFRVSVRPYRRPLRLLDCGGQPVDAREIAQERVVPRSAAVITASRKPGNRASRSGARSTVQRWVPRSS